MDKAIFHGVKMRVGKYLVAWSVVHNHDKFPDSYSVALPINARIEMSTPQGASGDDPLLTLMPDFLKQAPSNVSPISLVPVRYSILHEVHRQQYPKTKGYL
jgi:hypothetical protein